MRLRKYDRENVVLKLIEHRFKKDVEGVIAWNANFAFNVYCDVYSRVQRRHMQELPKGWLPESDAIRVSFGEGGVFEVLLFSGFVYDIRRNVPHGKIKDVSYRMPSKDHRNVSKVYSPTDQIFKDWKEVKAATDELVESIVEARRVADRTLSNLGTVARIKKEWPEVVPFLGVPEAAPNLPAIPLTQLNERFNLP